MEPGRKSPKREICRSKARRSASRTSKESGINGLPPPSVSYTLGYMLQKKENSIGQLSCPAPPDGATSPGQSEARYPMDSAPEVFFMNNRPQIFRTLVISSCAALLFSVPVRSDEGMWTFDNPPLKQLQEKYHFTPTQQWLDHVRLSCVRLNDGGSGSFVSAHGLLLTNHHVARGQLQKNSTSQHDYLKNGFFAAM